MGTEMTSDESIGFSVTEQKPDIMQYQNRSGEVIARVRGDGATEFPAVPVSADVAAVLRRGVTRNRHGIDMDCTCVGCVAETTRLLNLLAAENYAVVKLPEGVAVAHGARLVSIFVGGRVDAYFIEDTP